MDMGYLAMEGQVITVEELREKRFTFGWKSWVVRV